MTIIRDKFMNKPGFNPSGLHKMKLPPPPPPPKEDVYTFSTDDCDDTVLFGANSTIRAGTLEKLVERLTSEKVTDPPFRQAFLLTYRTFTTPTQFLSILRARYYMQPPEKIDPVQWDTTIKSIRLKVVNVLRQWIQKGFYDFVDNNKLRKLFFQFLDEMLEEQNATAKNLQQIFEREDQQAKNKRFITFGDRKPPVPILPKVIPVNPSILDFHPEEIARQLTIIESALYRDIKPWECLNQSWSKKDKDKRAPRVLAMINRFNLVSNWFAAEVLRPETLKLRIAVLKHIIDIGDKCLALNNFNAVMEVVSGLQNSSVFRLKQTWSGLDKTKYIKMFEEQREVMEREQNYKNFRDHLHKANPPCIPYLGVYLTDLTFIEDGNQDLTGNLINFVKRRLVSEVITEIQQYQDTPYCLERVDAIINWLSSIEIISESAMYAMSLERESKSQIKNGQNRKRTLTKQLIPKPEREKRKDSSPLNSMFFSPYGELEEIKGYRFYDKDNETNIIFEEIKDDDRIIIKAGTLPKLVERLTYEKYPDTNYLFAFLMTYKTFTTANELLDLLIMRFNMPHPKAPTKEQAKQFKTEKLVPIHFRVFNVLKNWVEKYMIDFKQDTVLVQRVLDFVEKATESQIALEKVGTQIKNFLNFKKFDNKSEVVIPPFLGESIEKSKATMEPVNLEVILRTWDISAVADGIYYATNLVFNNFKPRECMQKVWHSPEARAKSPNLYFIRKNYEAMVRWVNTEIILSPDIKSRAQITEHLISIAEKLIKRKDYHDAFTILNTIAKLKEKELRPTWEWMYPKFIHLFNRLYNLNPKGDFTDIKKQKVSQIPFLNDDLNKLEIVHENPDFINNDLINFEKRQAIYYIYSNMCVDRSEIQDIDMESNPDIQNLLSHLRILPKEEILVAAENMNNERPEGIPPTQKSNEHESKISEETLNEVFGEQLISLLNCEEIRPQLLALLNYDSHDNIVESLLSDTSSFGEIVKQILLLQMGMGSSSSYAIDISRSVASRILEKKFVGKIESVSLPGTFASYVYHVVQEEDSNWIKFTYVTEFISLPIIQHFRDAFEQFVADSNAVPDSYYYYPCIVGLDADLDVFMFARNSEIQVILL